MATPETVTDGATFRTAAGGCIPMDPAARALLPTYHSSMLVARQTQLASTGAATDWAAQFLHYYRGPFQGGSGICTGDATAAAIMACATNIQGWVIPQVSGPFVYYATTRDATFSRGWSVYGMMLGAAQNGICTDALYPEAAWLANWANDAPYAAAALPQPPAFADGLTRRVLQFVNVVDAFDVIQLLDAGHPVTFGLGNHCWCLLMNSADKWTHWGPDSELQGQDIGFGPGMRGLTTDALEQGGYDFTTVMLVDTTGGYQIGSPPIITPPPQGGTVTPAQINSAIVANEPWNATDYAALQAAVAAAAPVVVQQPPPTTGYVDMPQPNGSATDANGYHWQWGPWVSDRYGYQLLCNGRAIKTALKAGLGSANSIVADDAGQWYQFSGTPFAPVWTPVAAPV